MNSDLVALAKSVEPFVLTVREELHRMPHTRWEEDPTLNRIKEILTEITGRIPSGESYPRVEFWDHVPGNKKLEGGLVVDLVFDPSLEMLLFRSDVDGLPILEETGLPFASELTGKSHACGHDVHPAMLLGAFELFALGKAKSHYNLRFVFQRAEENPGTAPRPESGGEVLVNEGVLKGVKAAFGLHIWNSPQEGFGTPGVFYSRPGPLLGNSGRFMVRIKAKGGHVMKPYNGTNARRIADMIGHVLDTFVARRINPLEPVTLEPVIENCGKASNALAQDLELWYGFRTMLPREEHMALMDEMEKEVRIVLQLFPGAELVDVKNIGGHPATINTPELFEPVAELLRKEGQMVKEHPAVLGGEDFAHYLRACPGGFWFLGAYTPGSGDHHTTTFQPDPSVFYKGVLFWLTLAAHE